MKSSYTEKNWVPKKMLKLMGVIWLVTTLVGIVFYKIGVFALVCGILSFIMLLLLVYFTYSYYELSSQGGDLQTKISDLVTNQIKKDSKGKLLDIGCGSGVLSVELAVKCPALTVYGIDYWVKTWDYSKEGCEELAKKHNVSERVRFERASASSLPFPNSSFDFVISNMVFHEVADAKDKREVIKEALRVLKKDGVFAFQDLFLSKRLFGNPNDLTRYITDLGINQVTLEKTNDKFPIPPLLNVPFFFGDTALLIGKK